MGAGYSTCCSQSILPAGCIASSANALPACVGEAVSESTSAEGRAAIGLEARLAFQRSRLFTRSSCIPPLEVLTLGKFLGSGSFGCVYSAFSLRHRRANEDDFSAAFAVKVFGKSALSGSKDPSDLRMWAARCESFRVERAMLAALEHPHIVLLRESFESHADMQLAMESSGVDRPGFVQLPFRIGLISDIQYADSDIGSDYSGQERRYYRDALDIARRAVECWNAADVDAVVQLGDVIDGKNGWVGASASSSVALARVLGVLDQCTAKDRLDLIGNHELYNFPRSELATCLRCVDKAGKTYYSRSFGSRFEAIVLDPYEHALIGMKDTDAGHKAAVDILSKKNPQALQEGANWFKGVPHADLRYVPFNGGMSAEQLAWLSTALEEAEAAHRTVLVFSHVPVYEAATNARTLVWDADKVMELLHRHRQSVLAVVSGHDHDGGYAVDDTGIHHITLRSPLITEPGSDCFAVLECFPDGTAHFVSHGFACPGLDDMVLSRKTTMA